MSAEIPYRWRVTTQIGVVLLIRWKFASAGQKHYPVLGRGKHHQCGISGLLPLTSFRQVISGSDLKCRLFSLADWNTMAEHGVDRKELTFCRREKHYTRKAHRSYLPSKKMFREDCRLNILQQRHCFPQFFVNKPKKLNALYILMSNRIPAFYNREKTKGS